MKAYDYGFLGAIAATLLATAGGMVWLSTEREPAPATRTQLEAQEPAPEPMRSVALEPARGEPSTGSIPFSSGAILVEGVVTDSLGSALAGVRVRPEGGLAPETLTGPQGRYRLLLPFEPAWSRPVLRFLADGYEDGRAELESDAPETRADVRLEARRGRTVVSGRLVGQNGEPVFDELVELESAQLDAIHTARTDAEGRFFLPNVAVSDDYELHVRPRGPYRQLWQFPLEATATGLDLELVLEHATDDRMPTSTAFRLDLSATP